MEHVGRQGRIHGQALPAPNRAQPGAVDPPHERVGGVDPEDGVGAVGQPRDGDPRAAYALLDDEAMTMEFRRVPYDIAATQALMRDLKMPRRLIKRLEQGM